MKYLGSKNRISKALVPVIQKYIDDNGCTTYIEPFVGGANVMDKVVCENKVGYDVHKELIALLNYIKVEENWENIPDTINEEEYKAVRDDAKLPISDRKYPLWYTGLVGFCATYGAKWFGGFARGFKNDGITPRDHANEGIRNIKKQSGNSLFKEANYVEMPFQQLNPDDFKGCVIYCDPPYKGTTGYKGSGKFPYEEFYDWCKKLQENGNIVLVSEYNMPEEMFECIWVKQHISTVGKNDAKRIEKLFIVKEG